MADQELVVKFKGDTSDLERAFERAGRLADTYSGGTGKATSATQKFDRAGGDLNNTFGKMVKGYLTLSAAMEAGRMFLDATVKVQKYENQLKVASNTQEGYAKNTAFLEGLADKYNKNVLELGKSYAQLTIATRGTNLEGEKADRLFAAVTATSSALQMSVDETNGTFQAFIQMVSKGNVQAEELRGQLGERLYGAFNLAAKAMGVSTAELNKMLENGQVLASDLLPKLTIELERSFGAQAEKNAHNLGSAVDYATGQISLFFAELGKSSGVTGTLTTIAEKIGEIARNARDLGSIKPDKNSIWDMMFTLPGSSTGGISKLEGVMALVNAYRNPTGAEPLPDIGERRNRRQGIDASRKALEDSYAYANKLAEEAAEKKRKEAEAIISKWASEQIQMSKDRIAEGILDAEIANNAQYRKYNSPIDVPGQIIPEGLKNSYSFNGGEMRKTGQAFANELGTGASSLERMQHVIQGLNNTANLDWSKKLQADKLAEEIRKMDAAAIEMKAQVAEQLTAAFNQAAQDIPMAVGQMLASLAMGGRGMQQVGNLFFQIAADLFQKVGEALMKAAVIFEVSQKAIESMQGPVALAGAVLAFAAAGILRSQINNAGQQASGRFFSGGIERKQVSPGGVDNIPINVSAGEMILNSRQQRNMFALIDHGSQQNISSNNRGYGRGEQDVLITKWAGDDMALIVKRGERKLRKFR